MIKGKIKLPLKIKGKIDGSKIYPALEDLEVTPSYIEQNFKSAQYGYDNVKVKAIESEEIVVIPTTEDQIKEGMYNKVTVLGDSDLIPENIRKGTEIFGVEGTGNISNAKITDASYLFYYGARTDSVNDILTLCDKVTSTENMFYGCDKLTELDVSNFDMSNVTTAKQMFFRCKKLTKLDVSNFNTSNIIDMTSMFYTCENLKELDVSNFNTSNAKTMIQMFGYCETITELDVSNFNTNNVTDISSMFYNCENLTELDVSNFNTSNVTGMSTVFYNCKKITELDLQKFDMSKTIAVSDMFTGCPELTNLKSFKNLGKGYVNKSNDYYKYKLNLSSSTKLTKESLVDIITNGLYDLNLTYNVANGGILYTQPLQLGSTNLAKLTPEEIAIATSKGWNVS